MTDDASKRPSEPRPPAKPAVPPVVPGKAVVPDGASVPRGATVPPAVPARPVAPVVPVVVETKRGPAGPPPAPPPGKDPYIGKVVARCRIVERIGQGKTAVVYRADHTVLDFPVAVKILHSSILAFPELVASFDAEARAVARLDHPNVLKVFDVHTEGDVHAIVMELLEGESVLDLVTREKTIEPLDALRIVRQAAAGLAAAHAKGLIHRDVKPQNLVVLPDGTVKLVDFGLAAEAAADDPKAIRIGTPHYMAPEVCEARSVEPASDVYSLGISLYHLLVGQPPFAGQSIKEILRSHIEAKPLEPEKRRMGLPKALGDLVRAMTKRDSLTRMTLADVIATVDKLGGEELKANLKLRPRRRSRRGGAKGAPVVAIAIGALVLVGIGAAILAGGGSDPSSSGANGTGANGTGANGTTGPKDPVASTGVPPVPPTAPVESEAERKAREEKDAEYKKKEREARIRQSWAELEDARGFARLTFADKGAVVARYRLAAKRFSDTDMAKEAKRLAEGIEKGELHPHPDRSYSEKNAVTRAQEAWEKLRGEVEKAIAEFRYDDAVKAVPPAVEDPEGKLSEDVEFYRTVATDLVLFRGALDQALDAMKPEPKQLTLASGKVTVRRVLKVWISVAKADGVIEQIPWAEVPLDEVAELAKRAFASEDSSKMRALATFEWAHKRRVPFFQTAVAMKTALAMSGGSDPYLEKLFARAKERFKD